MLYQTQSEQNRISSSSIGKRAWIKPRLFCLVKKLNSLTGALLLLSLTLTLPCFAETGIASWYSVDSCLKESGQYVMANGERLRDDVYTCASWDYPFGSVLRVTNLATRKYIMVKVTDRGPARRLYKKGRIIDLSKRAFSEIADLKQGLIQVEVKLYIQR